MQKSYRAGSAGMFNATPGTYLVHAYFDDNQVDLVRANVLGWHIAPDRRITPLVMDPRAVEDDEWVVQHPDGRIEGATGICWEDIDLWIDEQKRVHRNAA